MEVLARNFRNDLDQARLTEYNIHHPMAAEMCWLAVPRNFPAPLFRF